MAFGDSRTNSNWMWNLTTHLKPIQFFNWATAQSEPDNIAGIQDRMYIWRKYNFTWGDVASGGDGSDLCLICEYNLTYHAQKGE